jgi:hypothetical protein
MRMYKGMLFFLSFLLTRKNKCDFVVFLVNNVSEEAKHAACSLESLTLVINRDIHSVLQDVQANSTKLQREKSLD